MNQDNVAIRLKGYIESTGLSSSQFADQCAIPRPTLSQLLSGRNKKISDVLVGQIHANFPDLSILWLLFGEGDMLITEKDPQNTDNESDSAGLAPISNHNITDPSSGENSKLELTQKRGSIGGIYKRDELENLLIEKERTIDSLRQELDQFRKSPRRVSQITVYYDDSTFETFYPVSSSGRGR